MLAHLIKRQQSRSIHLRQADKEKEVEKVQEAGVEGEEEEGGKQQEVAAAQSICESKR